MVVDVQSLERIVEWAAYHDHPAILQASLEILKPFEDSVNQHLTKLLKLCSVRNYIQTFTYHESPDEEDDDILDVIIEDLHDMKQTYGEDILSSKEAFHALRLCIRQKALKLLSENLFGGNVPEEFQDLSIPSSTAEKNKLLVALKQQLQDLFDQFSYIYESRKGEYDYDVKIFAEKLIKANEESSNDKGKNPNVTKKANYNIDVQEALERFQTYSVESFRVDLTKFLDNIKEKAHGAPYLHVTRTVMLNGRIVPMQAFVGEHVDWSATKEGPYKQSFSNKKSSPFSDSTTKRQNATSLEKTAESNSSNAKRALRSNTSIVSKPLALPHSDEDSSEDEVQRMLATASAKKKTLSTPIGAKTATTSRTPAPAPAPASASAKDSNTKPVQEKMKNDSKHNTTAASSSSKTVPKDKSFTVTSSSSATKQKPQSNSSSAATISKKRKASSISSTSSSDISDDSIDDVSSIDEKKVAISTSQPKKQPHTSTTPKSGSKKVKSDKDRNQKSQRRKWTPDEENALIQGIAKHGAGNWLDILEDPQFQMILKSRTNVNLKDKFRTLVQAGILSHSSSRK